MADFDPKAYLAESTPPESGPSFDPKEYLRTETLQERRGTLGQQALAGLEGVAQGIAGPLAPAAEIAAGVSPESIRERKEANPWTSGLGEGVGLTGSMLTGIGEGALLEKAGATIASGIQHKIGRAAIKAAAEGALYQAGDELSKVVLHDPAQSVGSAVASVGLAGLLGGSLGALSGSVSPLWKATVGKRLQGVLDDVVAKDGEAAGQEAAGVAGPRLDPFTKIPVPEPNPAQPLGAPKPLPEEATQPAGIGAGNALSLLLAATGHGHAAVLTKLADILRKPGMEVLKRASLKFLGTDSPVSAEGFAAMADMLGGAAKGAELTKNATTAIFGAGSRVIPSNAMPTKDDVKQLDSTLKHLEENPGALLGKSDHLGHYLPDHSAAAAQLGAEASNYLNSLRPRQDRQSPLDEAPAVSTTERQRFYRALQVAQQPLLALQHVKDGSLVPQDVETLQQLYPKLYADMATRLTSAMVNHLDSGKSVPYHIQQALSLFGGHELNSTMLPQSIQAAQMTHQLKQSQPASGKPASAKSKLGALAAESATPEQQRSMHRATKG